VDISNRIPLSQLSFPAYVLESDSKQRVRSSVLSLAHFFEAEKFRGKDAALYEAVINSPTIRELRKLTKRYQTHWREDWIGVRGRALVCGMRYASWADPNPERWTTEPERLEAELIELGFPAKFSAAAVNEYARLEASATWVFFGTDKAPPDVIGKRVNVIHRKHLRAWTLCHWLGRHSNWRIHDWALNQFIPVSYRGDHGDSLGRAAIDQLLLASSHACIFEQRGGKDLDSVIRQVRGIKFPLEMEFYNGPLHDSSAINQTQPDCQP